MLSVRAHPNDWAFCINKLACYQTSITLYGQLVLESASLPHILYLVNLDLCYYRKRGPETLNKKFSN